MTEQEKMPAYMAQLLEELGWNQGTRIPLANSHNQTVETLLINRQNEIQALKEALQLQNQKRNDLNKYKEHIHTEYQENTRLLFAHKQQMEQEVKLKQLSCNETERLERDIINAGKQSKDIGKRIDGLQAQIGRLLKKADGLKREVCGERGALQEWRAALERASSDITAIERFTKQDTGLAKALETKRMKLKVEHDKMQERLFQLVGNLGAEERACGRISEQVIEGMEQRKQMMLTWAGAVENMRQRDVDIRHIREDYAVLEVEATRVTEQCREQQTFCEQQRQNNEEAKHANMQLEQQLSRTRLEYTRLLEANVSLDSECKSLQRELSNMRNTLEKLHMENRRIMEEQHRKDLAIKAVKLKVRELKEKLTESLDKTKSSEKRAKQLEDILNDEERYASQLTVNQQRALHCSFVEQQRLLVLKNEEKLLHMQLKSSKAIMSKLDYKQRAAEKKLQVQKESCYGVSYQVETIGARVAHMEGEQEERMHSAELLKREQQLMEVCARHAARVALLERHSAKLHDDMRRLTKEVELSSVQHGKLQSRLKTSMLNVEGGGKELKESRVVSRRLRVEEVLLRLRVAHATRGNAGLDDAGFSLDKQRLQLEGAMKERLVEIAARKEMFSVQKRELFEVCGKLRSEIKERESRIEQLKKRYEIFIASLGKDESGQQLTVSFFKIKFAAERAELRERGAALDVDIGRCERDVSALEATLRVMHAAQAHFLRHITPLEHDTPEIIELTALLQQYYSLRDEYKQLTSRVSEMERRVSDLTERHTLLGDKCRQLTTREVDAESEVEGARERVARQQSRLENARESTRHHARRAKKLIEGGDHWRTFQLALWVRDLSEAAQSALQALVEACSGAPGASARLAALLASTDLVRQLTPHQRRLQAWINRVLTSDKRRLETLDEPELIFSESSSSTRSGVSVASGYTKRVSGFSRHLATKIQEPALVDGIPEQARRSTVSLHMLTLDMEERVKQTGAASLASRRASGAARISRVSHVQRMQ